jgi:hypothetical protein
LKYKHFKHYLPDIKMGAQAATVFSVLRLACLVRIAVQDAVM